MKGFTSLLVLEKKSVTVSVAVYVASGSCQGVCADKKTDEKVVQRRTEGRG